MSFKNSIRGWKDKILFTPGPLTTSQTIKQAMLRDLGSRDFEFIDIVRTIRNQLLAIGGVSKGEYEAIPMQGSGTFALESVVSSTIPPKGKLLVIINGAYGNRIAQMAEINKIDTVRLPYPENSLPNLEAIHKILTEDSSITHVAVIHCETTTGIMNPIKEIGDIVQQHNRIYFVDAMSSFGAVPINLKECQIDYLVSSANKCIEGVPGFAFVLAKTSTLMATEGFSRSLSFDLVSQWKGLENNGQFRFTPPTHTLLAFHQALIELQQEGGVIGRAVRYHLNYSTLIKGMQSFGFREYLPKELQGYIITSFLYPEHPNFSFEKFYHLLNEKDQVIYPGKVSNADCFRIGNIGRIFKRDVETLLSAIETSLKQMNVNMED